MALDPDDATDNTGNLRKERRQQEDKKRMAYRRAIEEYRESQALHAMICDFPDFLYDSSRASGRDRHSL